MRYSSRAAVIFALVFIVMGTTPVRAQRHTVTRAREGTVIFRLRVAGQPSPGTQFWVAYGPVAGRFGILRLRATSAGTYSAARTLPILEPTSVAYLAARGQVRTRAGLEPAHVLAIIFNSGPISLLEAQRHVPRWQAPVG